MSLPSSWRGIKTFLCKRALFAEAMQRGCLLWSAEGYQRRRKDIVCSCDPCTITTGALCSALRLRSRLGFLGGDRVAKDVHEQKQTKCTGGAIGKCGAQKFQPWLPVYWMTGVMMAVIVVWTFVVFISLYFSFLSTPALRTAEHKRRR